MAMNDRVDPVDGDHPEPERLAAYIDGTLEAELRPALEAHLGACADCREVALDGTAATELDGQAEHSIRLMADAPRRGLPRWTPALLAGLAAAAGLVLAVRVLSPSEGLESERALRQLVAVVGQQPSRPLPGLLSGGFRYAPAPIITRGGQDAGASPDLRIAAAEAEKRLAGHSPAELAGRAVALAVGGELDRAIVDMESALASDPEVALRLSDLSAIYLARAQRGGASSDLAAALGAADRALAAAPGLHEAEFNRAQALEAMGRREEAREAWNRCLQNGVPSGWTEEIRARIAALE